MPLTNYRYYLVLFDRVSASSTSRSITGLWVGITLVNLCTLNLHKCETNISSLWVLVKAFTRVDSRSIWTVSIKCLERVEVHCTTCCGRVPLCIDVLLSIVIPDLIIILSIVEKYGSAGAGSECGRGESVGARSEGDDGN